MSRRGLMEMDAALNDPANQIGTSAWAKAQSDEALEYHLEGTDPGSQSYEIAVRELARRDAARSDVSNWFGSSELFGRPSFLGWQPLWQQHLLERTPANVGVKPAYQRLP